MAILTIIGVVAKLIVESIPAIRDVWKRYKDEYPDEKKDEDFTPHVDVTEEKKGGNYADL